MHNENHTGALLKQATEPEETAEVSPGQNTGFGAERFQLELPEFTGSELAVYVKHLRFI